MPLGFLPLLLPVLPSIVQSVESMFGGRKRGKFKKKAVVRAALDILREAKSAGVISDTGTAGEIGSVVEGVLAAMKRNGQLTEAGKTTTTTPAATPATITLEPGREFSVVLTGTIKA